MIRAADFSHAAGWGLSPSAPRGDVHDISTWLDSDAGVMGVRIAAHLSFAARGLSVEQHAQVVLAHLCGGRDGTR